MKKVISYMFFVLMMSSILLMNRIYTNVNSEYYNCKNKLFSLKEKDKNNNKNINEYLEYNNIIHISNKYSGEIKEFNRKNKNVIASMSIAVNKESMENILDDLKKEQNIKNINSIALEKKNNDLNEFTMIFNAEFANYTK